MLERDMGHYIVINRNDVDAYLNDHGKETLQVILEGIESGRRENGKDIRDYVVVSDKRPALYEEVWETVLTALEQEGVSNGWSLHRYW